MAEQKVWKIFSTIMFPFDMTSQQCRFSFITLLPLLTKRQNIKIILTSLFIYYKMTSTVVVMMSLYLSSELKFDGDKSLAIKSSQNVRGCRFTEAFSNATNCSPCCYCCCCVYGNSFFINWSDRASLMFLPD